MSFVSSTGRDHATAAVQQALRDARGRLALLTRQVALRLGLKDGDLECLDLIARNGPLGPGALARLAGIHPATMTGVLDRLERAGWAVRERDPGDRRAVVVKLVPERISEIVVLYRGMGDAVSRICGDYDVAQLAVIADFLTRAAKAGEAEAARLGRS